MTYHSNIEEHVQAVVAALVVCDRKELHRLYETSLKARLSRRLGQNEQQVLDKIALAIEAAAGVVENAGDDSEVK